MKILQVVGWLAPRYGGTVAAVTESVPWVAARGHQIEVVTTNIDGSAVLDVEIGRRVEWGGLTATFHPVNPPRAFLTSWALLRDLRRRVPQFDVVHIHSLYRFHTIAAAHVARANGVPYVLQAHGALDPWNRRRRRVPKDIYHHLVENSIIRRAATVVCTSSQEEQGISDLGLKVPTSIIPIGIDTAALRTPATTGASRVLAGIDADSPVITFLGRISAVKGLDLLLEAFRETATKFAQAHLVVAGPDDEGIVRDLIPTIAAAGLSNLVSFVGPVAGPEKTALLQRSSVFVLPSAGESFGIAVAEAMAVGCPVVVTPRVAIQDAVRSAGAGIVVNRDAPEIAGAISSVISNPTMAAAMGQAGRRFVDERLAWPRVANTMESMYEAAVSGSQTLNA